MKFPNKLREMRDKTLKSQDDLAAALKKAGIKNPTKQKINKIEKGKQGITPGEAAVFAKELGCSIGDILPNIEAVPAPTTQPNDDINHSGDAMMALWKRSTEEAQRMFLAGIGAELKKNSSKNRTPGAGKRNGTDGSL